MESESRKLISVEDAALAFSALGSEQRISVLQVLVRAGPDGLTIGELGNQTGITGSTLTHHLKFLSHAGLVSQQRAGRSVICAAVAYDMIDGLREFLVRNCCSELGPSGCRHRAGRG